MTTSAQSAPAFISTLSANDTAGTSASLPSTIPSTPDEPVSSEVWAAAGAPADHYIGASTGDVLVGPADQPSYIRGDAGDNLLTGGAGFSDINGGQGADTIIGHSQVGDWLAGGQGADVISAQSDAHNLICGNLGDDTLSAGAGGDTLRGGQGDDSIGGGAGADWLSGDKGHDTVTGGGGADAFHGAQGMGATTVTDFHVAEGDHVVLDAGTQYSTSQVGGDVHVDIVGGGELVLKNVQLSSLGSGWLTMA